MDAFERFERWPVVRLIPLPIKNAVVATGNWIEMRRTT